MRYAVFGPRSIRGKLYNNYEYIGSCLGTLPELDTVIHGGSQGVEEVAAHWASDNNIAVEKIAPDFKRGDMEVVFTIRNRQIIYACDVVVVFWDGVLNSIMELFERSVKAGKMVRIFPLN